MIGPVGPMRVAGEQSAIHPVSWVPKDKAVMGKPPQPGIALCLSGGGYRAMLFHLGALWRLNELGLLPRLDKVSSVSGGSITAGQLGLAWSQLRFDSAGVAQNFLERVVQPIRGLASLTIDVWAVFFGWLGFDVSSAPACCKSGPSPSEAIPMPQRQTKSRRVRNASSIRGW